MGALSNVIAQAQADMLQAQQKADNAKRESSLLSAIDNRYNNGGRAYYRDQAVNDYGNQQLVSIDNQFGHAQARGNQRLARRGLQGGSADLTNKYNLSKRLQDARANVSGNLLRLSNQLAAQDESSRVGMRGQVTGALDANTAGQNSLTGLATQLNNNQSNLNNNLINGIATAGVGAYNQNRIDGQNAIATSNYQSVIPQQRTMTMNPSAGRIPEYLNY